MAAAGAVGLLRLNGGIEKLQRIGGEGIVGVAEGDKIALGLLNAQVTGRTDAAVGLVKYPHPSVLRGDGVAQRAALVRGAILH